MSLPQHSETLTMSITEDMIDRALARMAEETDLPYMARIVEHGPEGIKAADTEADRQNREFMRDVLQAALGPTVRSLLDRIEQADRIAGELERDRDHYRDLYHGKTGTP